MRMSKACRLGGSWSHDPRMAGPAPIVRTMTFEGASSNDPADSAAAGRQDAHAGTQKRVEPLELFFDLVFVFAITQVTARLAAHTTWGGLFEGLLILSAIWWAWGAYAW